MTNEAQPAEDGVLALRDGRQLGYAQYGQPDGAPIVYFHGHPVRAWKHPSRTKQRRGPASG